MRLFLTIETEDNGLAKIMRDINSRLNFVTDRNTGLDDVDNYGTEFKSIGVIPSCISKEYLDILGWKERKQIWRKKQEADIRLFMDFERFIEETPEIRRLMYIDIIVKSIMVVQERSKGDFRGKELINDILKALNVTHEQLDCLSLN